MIDKSEICKLALECGFKLKEQADGTMDLNPYVYDFAKRLLERNDDSLDKIVFGLTQVTHFDVISDAVNNSVKMTFEEATGLITGKLNELNPNLKWTAIEQSESNHLINCRGLGSHFAILVTDEPFAMQTGKSVNNLFKDHFETFTIELDPILLEQAKEVFHELTNGKA